jgi:hypothetical protein
VVDPLSALADGMLVPTHRTYAGSRLEISSGRVLQGATLFRVHCRDVTMAGGHYRERLELHELFLFPDQENKMAPSKKRNNNKYDDMPGLIPIDAPDWASRPPLFTTKPVAPSIPATPTAPTPSNLLKDKYAFVWAEFTYCDKNYEAAEAVSFVSRSRLALSAAR